MDAGTKNQKWRGKTSCQIKETNKNILVRMNSQHSLLKIVMKQKQKILLGEAGRQQSLRLNNHKMNFRINILRKLTTK